MVRATAGSKMARDWNVSTGDGSMVLYVDDGLDAALDAEARDGAVKLDSGLVFAHESGERSRNTAAAASAPAARAWCCAAATARSASAGFPAARRRHLPPAAPSRPARSPRRTLIATVTTPEW